MKGKGHFCKCAARLLFLALWQPLERSHLREERFWLPVSGGFQPVMAGKGWQVGMFLGMGFGSVWLSLFTQWQGQLTESPAGIGAG